MTDILKLLTYSALSYEKYQPFDGSEKIISVNRTDSGVQYYIRILQKTIYIAFRGSDSLRDAFADIKFTRKNLPFCNPDNKIKVHRGFLNAYLSAGVRDRILSYISEETEHIFFTGHSYGAALALICAYDICCQYPDLDYSVAVYGCPRVGNMRFATEYNKKLPDTVRIENGNDAVAKIPPAVFGYRHVGKMKHFGPPKVFGVYSISDHAIVNYLKNIKGDGNIL